MTLLFNATPRVKEFLISHSCGQKLDPEIYGDDWSHYDIEAFVDLAIDLEKELITLKKNE